jgi:hypothetical protein
MSSSDNHPDYGPPGWYDFAGATIEIQIGGPYCQRERSWGEDFKALQQDAQAGVPLAVDLLARFMAERLRR